LIGVRLSQCDMHSKKWSPLYTFHRELSALMARWLYVSFSHLQKQHDPHEIP
jgi:hypothetical protein